jgi:hypothetical protein
MTEGHFYLAKADIGIAKCAHSRVKTFFSRRDVRFSSRAGTLQDLYFREILNCVFPRARDHFRISRALPPRRGAHFTISKGRPGRGPKKS